VKDGLKYLLLKMAKPVVSGQILSDTLPKRKIGKLNGYMAIGINVCSVWKLVK